MVEWEKRGEEVVQMNCVDEMGRQSVQLWKASICDAVMESLAGGGEVAQWGARGEEVVQRDGVDERGRQVGQLWKDTTCVTAIESLEAEGEREERRGRIEGIAK
ncbi:hypothetical protein GOP47_0018373 [Adiantum capillus-veneris]|uniref:Uncharacterized protein n=1 Tax=Adiantum capillus-veneris TaxID=13818 RepID=A0A9D4UD10_ADICA|nr:hypothetical protein GOP47_0018373 [Adiantum capillus-veneris]